LGTGQTIFNRHFISKATAAVACSVMLSGCMTTSSKEAAKNKDVAEASEPAPEVIMRTPAEQLAAEMNAKAKAQSLKSGAYRDPQVRTASGQQLVAQQQSATALYPAQPQAPASAAMAPANIGGLVTQPTTVNANRSSIYSAPPPIAVNPDGTLAPISANVGPGATPALRSVYSTPAGGLVEQQQASLMPQAPAQQAFVVPQNAIPQTAMPQNSMVPQSGQSSQSGMPQYAPRPMQTSVSRPTADARPSHILPSIGSKGKHLDSQEALMMARNLASGGQKAPVNTMMPQASSGLTLPAGVTLPPGVTLTPGMAASLK
jgi:hypothetical protein